MLENLQLTKTQSPIKIGLFYLKMAFQYERFFDNLTTNGIRPFVTLIHYLKMPFYINL